MINLATLSQATEQEVFDQVVSHMLTQGERSEGDDGCVYRGPNGLKCAAGCLISDEEYNSDMDNNPEGTSWQDLAARDEVPSKHLALISRLQGIHDGIGTQYWPVMLQEEACQLGLKFNVSTED
ncbi:hypothetical protein 16Q_140 [Pseudomonas phage 16Q]|nr:hypothetical protein 16Q_140 [Pseudomonas phage 16Q]